MITLPRELSEEGNDTLQSREQLARSVTSIMCQIESGKDNASSEKADGGVHGGMG
jgi:hypothetical protein